MLEDQASRLRLLAKNYDKTSSGKQELRIIAVSSGKGGVGKTNVTINLAIAMAELGKRVVVFDGDLGLANIDVICGLTPTYTLEDVLTNTKTLAEILIEGPKGIKILPGSSGRLLADIDTVQLQELMDRMQYLEDVADILLIDTGAGISHHVIQLLGGADEIIVVATPEPTSLTDAYGLMKTLLAERKNWEIGVLINRAQNREDADSTFSRIEAAVQRFLQYDIKYFGYVFEDHFVAKSVRRQIPFVISFPKAPASQCIITIAGELIGVLDKSLVPGKGIRGLMQGLVIRLMNKNVST